MNTGDDAMMDVRYANILTVIYVVMFYGSGIPIMYVLAAVYFFSTYWFDKVLILDYYKKPNVLDESMTL